MHRSDLRDFTASECKPSTFSNSRTCPPPGTLWPPEYHTLPRIHSTQRVLSTPAAPGPTCDSSPLLSILEGWSTLPLGEWGGRTILCPAASPVGLLHHVSVPRSHFLPHHLLHTFPCLYQLPPLTCTGCVYFSYCRVKSSQGPQRGVQAQGPAGRRGARKDLGSYVPVCVLEPL